MPALTALALFAVVLPNAVVVRPVANIYARPAEDAEVTSQVIYGANVTLLEQKDDWARIRTADDYTGWTLLPYLRKGQAYAAQGRIGEVQSLFAHIYLDASVTHHAPLLTVPFETRLEVLDEPTGLARWLQVRLPDDRSAFVQSGDVEFKPQLLTLDEMVDFSRHFLGLPYTWGGTSSYGYDCSGFMQMLLRRRGFRLPRDSQPQADWDGLMPISHEYLEPGDLLYFGSSEKKITHTGMYLGDGKFISATAYQHPMVRIDDLEDPHWTRLLVAMRRVK